jgi:mono/diheme cytochrome c family protein
MKPFATTLLLACLMVGAMPSGHGAQDGKTPQGDAKDWANPAAASLQTRGAATPEEALYVEKCSMCHREMGMGTVILARRLPPGKAMLEQRDDLSAALIQAMVRTGAGNMPRLGRGEVSDEQLAVITRHLLRKKTP